MSSIILRISCLWRAFSLMVCSNVLWASRISRLSSANSFRAPSISFFNRARSVAANRSVASFSAAMRTISPCMLFKWPMKLSKTVRAASRLLVTSTMKPSMASMSFSLPNKPPRLHDTFLPFRVFLAVGLKLLLLNEVGIDATGEVSLRRARARLRGRLLGHDAVAQDVIEIVDIAVEGLASRSCISLRIWRGQIWIDVARQFTFVRRLVTRLRIKRHDTMIKQSGHYPFPRN